MVRMIIGITKLINKLFIFVLLKYFCSIIEMHCSIEMKSCFIWNSSNGYGLNVPITDQNTKCAHNPINLATFSLLISSKVSFISFWVKTDLRKWRLLADVWCYVVDSYISISFELVLFFICLSSSKVMWGIRSFGKPFTNLFKSFFISETVILSGFWSSASHS